MPRYTPSYTTNFRIVTKSSVAFVDCRQFPTFNLSLRIHQRHYAPPGKLPSSHANAISSPKSQVAQNSRPTLLRQTLLPLESEKHRSNNSGSYSFPLPSFSSPLSKGNFFFQRSKDPVQRRACTVLKLYTISRVYGIRHIAFPDKFEVIANYERQQLEHSRASARILLKFLSLYSNYSKHYSEERLKYNLNPCLDPLSSIIEPLSFLFFSLFLFFFLFSFYPIVSGKIASESIPERQMYRVERWRERDRAEGTRGGGKGCEGGF